MTTCQRRNEPPVPDDPTPTRTPGANGRLRRQGHPGPRGPRPGPQAARHVHRLDRSGRPPPPHLGGRRQLRRRGDGGLLHAHRRHAAGRRRLPRRRQRPWHPGRPVPVRSAQGQERGRGRAHRAARRRQVRRRGLQGLRRSARRRRQRRQRAVRAADRRGRPRRQALPPGVRQGRQAAGQDGESSARRRPAVARPGTTVTFWPDPTVFVAEGTEFVARTVLERLQTMAFLNRGLEIVFVDERAEKEQKVTYQYKGGIVDFVKHLNASKEALFSQGLPLRGRGRRRPDARHRHPVEHRLLRGHPRLRQRHLHHRGRHARRGLQDRAHRRSSTSTPGPRTCSRRRTRTSSARTSARASRRSSR